MVDPETPRLPSPKSHFKNSSLISSKKDGVSILNTSGKRRLSGLRQLDDKYSQSFAEKPNKNELKGFLESNINTKKSKRRMLSKQTHQIDTVRHIHPHGSENVRENGKSISSIQSSVMDNHPTFRQKAKTELFTYGEDQNAPSPISNKLILNPSTRAEIFTRNNDYKDEEEV